MGYIYTLIKTFIRYLKTFFLFIEVIIKKRFLHYFYPFNNFVSFKILAYHGLGNQLFQYAVARSYSLKYNVPLILSEPSNNRLDSFNIQCNYVKTKNLEIVDKSTCRESEFCYNDQYFNYRNRKYFIGLFQTEKYFYNYRNVLLNELTLKDEKVIEYCKKYVKEIKDKNSDKPLIALHNRRGDNVPSKKNYDDREDGSFRIDKHRYHPLLSKNYIKNAMSYFTNSIFLVFSNNDEDITWCEDNIKGKNVYYSKGHNDLIDFTLMRMCDHNIIANSTFSWWAAWLNENPEKIVIVPKLWFGEAYSHFNLTDLIPNSWIII